MDNVDVQARIMIDHISGPVGEKDGRDTAELFDRMAAAMKQFYKEVGERVVITNQKANNRNFYKLYFSGTGVLYREDSGGRTHKYKLDLKNRKVYVNGESVTYEFLPEFADKIKRVIRDWDSKKATAFKEK